MTDDQIIEAAIQGHASTRDAIRWAIGQVREQSNTHQLPSVFEQNTHQHDDLIQIAQYATEFGKQMWSNHDSRK